MIGLGKITRGLGKVGLAFEALGYAWTAGSALLKTVKGKRSARDPSDSAGDPHGGTSDRGADDQPEFAGDQ